MSTYIKSLSTTAGFLENSKVEFDQGLTCIIGARGTCKSTLIESIRFAFDTDPKTIKILTTQCEDEKDLRSGMLKSTLNAGSVRCEVEELTTLGKSLFVLEREIGSDARIFQDGVREHAVHNILHNIEIFSQGDLQRIAEKDNHDLRLGLIDRPNQAKIKSLREQREEKSQVLLKVGSTLRSLRVDISSLRDKIQPLNELKEQLKQAEASCPALSKELETNRILFEKRNRIIEILSGVLSLQGVAISNLQHTQNYISQLSTSSDLVEQEAQPEAEKAIKLTRHIESDLREIATIVAKLGSHDLQSAIQELKNIFEEKNEVFYQLRQEQQAVNESLKKQENLRRQVLLMEKLGKELENAQNQEAELLNQREYIRAEIAELDNQAYSLRLKEVEMINKEHGKRVYLTLQFDAGPTGYTARLSSMLGGSRVRAQDEVASDLAKTFPPAKLIDIVESGNGQLFADVLGRDIGQMNRVVAYLSDHSELYELEAIPPAMRLDITMYDDGQPKSVESLSVGQKATALLPLVLRPLPYPLLFDQPEDDLDNHFIIESLVEEIRELKLKRQLIFVTHNANIPVLGEADKIIVMSMENPTKANSPTGGSVDERKEDVLKLLEGGANAFKRRALKYQDLLSKS